MENIFEKYPDLKEKLYDIVFEKLGGSNPKFYTNIYNTDIIVYNDGSITTFNYFGNVIHMNKDIACIITISQNDVNAWYEYWQECMTDAQKEYCKEKGWACCFESDSPNPEDWMEYKIDVLDLMEIDDNEVEQCIEKYERDLIRIEEEEY